MKIMAGIEIPLYCKQCTEILYEEALQRKSEEYPSGERASRNETEAQLLWLNDAVKEYLETYGVLPENLQELADEGLVNPQNLTDSWGNDFLYQRGTYTYRIISAGWDQSLHTEDDLEYNGYDGLKLAGKYGYERREKMYVNRTHGIMIETIKALETYALDSNGLPGSIDDLVGEGLYLDEIPRDSHGNEFRYEPAENLHYSLTARGFDTFFGTNDDLVCTNNYHCEYLDGRLIK
jgi:hypothetical protein